MALTAEFYQRIEPLFEAGFGTENVGPLLYALVRMTRPERVLEVGLGYTTPFIAQALKDNLAEVAADRDVLRAPGAEEQRRAVLLEDYYARDYAPKHYAIDNLSIAGQTAHRVLDVARALDLESVIELHEGDFRGHSERMNPACLPLDLVWFDCGDAPEYIDFINEYWPLINPNHGLLLLHFTYWQVTMMRDGRPQQVILCGSIANEIKRQQLAAGLDSRFEVLSLLEPHKSRQGSVTMVRKLGPASTCRDRNFQDEISQATGQPLEAILPLG
ncbi:MAG: class I SAM-dependent methyltransferase [Alphaproteobacteria bacterium]|nr:class I SAM-dependent methyltransferase [Alphaproteobacteria bacterium]